jgi:hypothetical protein
MEKDSCNNAVCAAVDRVSAQGANVPQPDIPLMRCLTPYSAAKGHCHGKIPLASPARVDSP